MKMKLRDFPVEERFRFADDTDGKQYMKYSVDHISYQGHLIAITADLADRDVIGLRCIQEQWVDDDGAMTLWEAVEYAVEHKAAIYRIDKPGEVLTDILQIGSTNFPIELADFSARWKVKVDEYHDDII